MLLSLFSPLQKRFCKLLKYQEVKTDNVVFRLHCDFTVAILIGASLVLTTTQLIGKPIDCVGSSNDKLKDWHKTIETWCWVNSTFLMPKEIENEIKLSDVKRLLHLQSNAINSMLSADGRRKLQLGKDVPYAGVMNEFASSQPKRHYTYYQWVCFVLFLQGLMCYIPKVLWKKCEAGLLGKLTSGLQGLCQKDELVKRTDAILSYLLRYRREHKLYTVLYWCCEVLCLVNLLLQMYLMNRFLGGDFFHIGLDALKVSGLPQHERTDPLIYIFPRMTKCTFYYYGPSGNIVNLDNLCLLPQNIINEKVYIFLWFWFSALSVLFCCLLFYRVALVALPRFRPRLLVARSRCVSIADARDASSILDFGDWWLLYMLARNMEPLAYRDLLAEFIKREKKINLYT